MSNPPDPACARTAAIAQRPAGDQAAGLALVSRAEDCQGRPLAALGCAGASGCDFAVSEDGAALDAVVPAALNKAGQQVFATLVLDVSSSMGPDLGLVIEGAKAFVTRLQLDLELPAHIGVWAFSGEGVVPIQEPTLDSQRLLARLDALGAAGTKANGKVDLNAAVARVLDRQAGLQAELERRNLGGAFTTGYVVVVTGDADGAGSRTLRPVTVATLPLDTGRVDPAALAAFADWNLPSSPDAATLYRDLSDLASRIASSSKAVYALAYCSPQQSGKHSVAVRTRAASAGAAAEFVFSAEGFSGGCAPGQLAALCAAGQQCGGTLCGACDDRTSICAVRDQRGRSVRRGDGADLAAADRQRKTDPIRGGELLREPRTGGSALLETADAHRAAQHRRHRPYQTGDQQRGLPRYTVGIVLDCHPEPHLAVAPFLFLRGLCHRKADASHPGTPAHGFMRVRCVR
jgi:hypothetical protein